MRELYILIMATVALSAMGVTAIMFISYIRPTADNLSLDTMVLGFLAPTIFTFMSALKSYQNGKAIEDLKVSTDGMSEKLVKTSAENATLVERAAGERTTTAVAAALVAAAAVAANAKHDSNTSTMIADSNPPQQQ